MPAGKRGPQHVDRVRARRARSPETWRREVHHVASSARASSARRPARCRSCTTRPTSLRARSTSITCSARSFGCSISSAAMRRSSLLGAAPAAGAGDRPADDPAVEQLHHRLRRRADERRLGVAQEVHVRRRVDLAQHAVDVERVGVGRRGRSAATSTTWKMSPARMCSLAASTAPRYTLGAHRRARRRAARRARRPGGGDGHVRQRPRELVDRELSSRATARVVGVGRGRRRRRRAAEHVLDQVEPLAEVVERGDAGR